MKKILATIAITAAALFTLQAADEAKEITKEGTMSCAKCNLSIADSCADVLAVKEGEEEVLYWLQEDGSGKTSSHKCSGTVDAVVKGKLEEKEDKKILAISSIETK